jgi:hypothetical protein
MAINTITITGKIIKANGTPVEGGSIIVTPQSSGEVDDGGVKQVVGGSFTVPISADGSVNFEIIPSAEYIGDSINYTAEFTIPDGAKFTREWNDVPGTDQDIGDL